VRGPLKGFKDYRALVVHTLEGGTDEEGRKKRPLL
jgi:hypothetical protein